MRKIELVRQVKVKRHGPQDRAEEDLLAVEEPLEIRLEYGLADARQQRNIAVTMRSPGHDLELAAGFLFSEGILRSANEIHHLDWCKNVQKPEEFGNVVKLELKPEVQPDLEKLDRNFYMSSSCGVCGKASIEALGIPLLGYTASNTKAWKADIIRSLPDKMAEQQLGFKHTGGIHAAAIFDESGQLLVLREDIGRHNALDKAIGSLLLAKQLPQDRLILALSGRCGFELVQKAAAAGIGLIVSIGAPSSLALDLAKSAGIGLVGFLRGERFNVYCGEVEE